MEDAVYLHSSMFMEDEWASFNEGEFFLIKNVTEGAKSHLIYNFQRYINKHGINKYINEMEDRLKEE